MSAMLQELAGEPNSSRFVAAVDWPDAKGLGVRKGVRVYDASSRQLESEFEIPVTDGPVHVALAGGKRPGVLAAPWRGGVTFWSLEGKPLWERRDLRKSQAAHVIPHGPLGLLFGVWVHPYAYHLLNPIMGGTRHLIPSCCRTAASFDGFVVMASRRGRWAGTWKVEPTVYSPAMKPVCSAEPVFMCAGREAFLLTWADECAAIDFSGELLWRRPSRRVLGPLAWNDGGYWVAWDASVAPNEMLAISPDDGSSRVISRLAGFAGSYSALLAGGGLLTGSGGKVFDVATGEVAWAFAEE